MKQKNNDSILRLSLVIPVYNESEAIRRFVEETSRALKNEQSLETEFIFVNDGSTDGTLEVLLGLQKDDPRIGVLDLSRNFGKEAALSAGLTHSSGDVVIPIDVDLQDPPELILEMISKWKEGYEVVLGRRIDRGSDSWAKRASANFFYRIHNKIANPQIPENVGDFRLMDRRVVEVLCELKETQRFMKGLFSWVGFRSTYVDYVRPRRVLGKTKFNGWKLWNFALEGITSFSSVPLRVWTYLGLVISIASFILGLIVLIKYIAVGIDIPGYASLMVSVTFLGGLQLIGIGFLGEYLGRNYIESKNRPVYVIRKKHISNCVHHEN